MLFALEVIYYSLTSLSTTQHQSCTQHLYWLTMPLHLIRIDALRHQLCVTVEVQTFKVLV